MCGLNIDLYMWFSQGSSADRSQWREPTRTSDGLCSLYEAALCLFEEVRYLLNFLAAYAKLSYKLELCVLKISLKRVFCIL